VDLGSGQPPKTPYLGDMGKLSRRQTFRIYREAFSLDVLLKRSPYRSISRELIRQTAERGYQVKVGWNPWSDGVRCDHKRRSIVISQKLTYQIICPRIHPVNLVYALAYELAGICSTSGEASAAGAIAEQVCGELGVGFRPSDLAPSLQKGASASLQSSWDGGSEIADGILSALVKAGAKGGLLQCGGFLSQGHPA